MYLHFTYSVGRRTKAPERGLRKKYHTPREAAEAAAPGFHELLEPLTLPPTKLEEKRTKIFRLYERKEKRLLAKQYEEAKKKEAALGHVDGQGKLVVTELSDYEKNKLKVTLVSDSLMLSKMELLHTAGKFSFLIGGALSSSFTSTSLRRRV